jgi:hypothetical protein
VSLEPTSAGDLSTKWPLAPDQDGFVTSLQCMLSRSKRYVDGKGWRRQAYAYSVHLYYQVDTRIEAEIANLRSLIATVSPSFRFAC